MAMAVCSLPGGGGSVLIVGASITVDAVPAIRKGERARQREGEVGRSRATDRDRTSGQSFQLGGARSRQPSGWAEADVIERVLSGRAREERLGLVLVVRPYLPLTGRYMFYNMLESNLSVCRQTECGHNQAITKPYNPCAANILPLHGQTVKYTLFAPSGCWLSISQLVRSGSRRSFGHIYIGYWLRPRPGNLLASVDQPGTASWAVLSLRLSWQFRAFLDPKYQQPV